MNKALFVAAYAVLFVFAAGAVGLSLEIFFGEGVQHSIESYSATVGAANQEAYYFVDFDENFSVSPGDADALSQATVAGSIVFEQYSAEGDCTWYVVVGNDASGSKIASNAFNGTVVDEGDAVFWAVKPNTGSVRHCSMSMDYNVMQ